MDEIISDLNLALTQCRGHIVLQTDDETAMSHLGEAVRHIEKALELLKSAQPRRPALMEVSRRRAR